MIDENRSALAWYAVHVKSRHEFQVFDRLTGAGIETFLPFMKKLRKWKDRNKLIDFPLFPGYLFVHTGFAQQSKLAVLKTKGVARILASPDGAPEPVPEEQILALKRLVESGIRLDPHPYLQEGQRVRITSGPLSGVAGTLVKKTDRDLLVLSVDIIRQSTSVTIDAADVEAIG